LVASGLSLIYGLMGVLNFAHGSFLTIGAFTGLWISTKVFPNPTTWTFIAAMIAGGIAAGLFALLMEQLVINRLYNRHIEQALVTVGVGLVVTALLAGWFGSDARLFPTPLWFMKAVTIGEAIIPIDRFIYIGVATILLIAMLSILRFTRIGLIIRAGVENRSMVSALGINVRLAFSTVFFIGGFAAGVGGVLISVFSYGVSPQMGGSWLIYGFIVVVVGGMGSIAGSAIAAMLIGITNQFANYYLTGLGDFVVVIILAAVLLTKPSGLLGKVNN
jgi:branched-chain amino acid transport system permease protein